MNRLLIIKDSNFSCLNLKSGNFYHHNAVVIFVWTLSFIGSVYAAPPIQKLTPSIEMPIIRSSLKIRHSRVEPSTCALKISKFKIESSSTASSQSVDKRIGQGHSTTIGKGLTHTRAQRFLGLSRDFFNFYLKDFLFSRFRRTPLMDQLPKVQVKRGELIGQGFEKRIFAGEAVDPKTRKKRSVAILQRRWMWPAKMAEEELRGLKWFKDHGFPVVEIIGKTPGPRPALVQKRLACGSKEIIAMFERKDNAALLKTPLNNTTIQMLNSVIRKLRTFKYTLPDLQVLIDKEGGIVFNDMVSPHQSSKPATDLDLRFLLTLRDAAKHAVDLRMQTSQSSTVSKPLSVSR